MQKTEAPTNTQNIQTTELMSELPIASGELFQYKQQYFEKQSDAKKKNYLLAIQSHNHELIRKIRQLDKKLNLEVEALNKKILIAGKKRPSVPKIQAFQSSQLRNKFQEMERLKKELENKKAGMDSLEFLLSVKQKYALKLSHLKNEIKIKTDSLVKFKKMHSKIMNCEDNKKREVVNIGQFDIFSDQIEELKRKVKEKNEKIKKKKQEFLSLYRQNKSSRSIVVQQIVDTKQEQSDIQLNNLKQQYQAMGKKVAILKAKKANLLKDTSENTQNIKALQKLKQKYEALTKILPK